MEESRPVGFWDSIDKTDKKSFRTRANHLRGEWAEESQKTKLNLTRQDSIKRVSF
jgi:hypothetical protein